MRDLVESKNLADEMDEEKLNKLSEQARVGFEYDLRSRKDWEKNLDDWTNLALQVKEEKTFPWPGASAIKYPLLSTAAMQFNARAYPSLIPSTGQLVKCDVLGTDPDGTKLEQATNVADFMSYQLLYEMEGWEEDMDKLLMMLPIVGTLFKKTYYNPVLKHCVSELILPKDIVVNFWAKNLETAERVSQVIRLTRRQIKERQQAGLYLKDVELGDPHMYEDDLHPKNEVMLDDTLPYQIIEQHTYADIRGDEYPIPVIITFERATGKILRITARFDTTGILVGADGEVAQVLPIQYYTKFPFIPNPSGGFYDIGFGTLLTPLNESVNTLVNQLVDAGTLNNLQGGILGKGIKLKMGANTWAPGEWKTAQTVADDLRKQILPLPTKEPSKVLLDLMQLLVTSGKELASVAEIFVGKMPGQNTPATTTMATIEQGMKVFTAVYKRIYRALTNEYHKLFMLNNIYLDESKYQKVLDKPVNRMDFDPATYNVYPSADPATPTQTEKLLKAQALFELLQTGTLDPVEVVKRILDAQEQPNVERLFTQEIQQTGQHTPPPDPKIQAAQMKAQSDQQRLQLEMQKTQFEAALEAQSEQARLAMEKQKHDMDLQFQYLEGLIKAQSVQQQAQVKMATSAQQHQQALVQNEQTHQQMQRHGEDSHALNMVQTEEKGKLAQKQQMQKSSATGRNTRSQKQSSKNSKTAQ